MNSKQLANVLIKILGVYLFLEGIPNGLAGLITGVLALRHQNSGTAVTSITWGVLACFQTVIALIFIIKSRKIAELLFKHEDE